MSRPSRSRSRAWSRATASVIVARAARGATALRAPDDARDALLEALDSQTRVVVASDARRRPRARRRVTPT